MKITNTSVFKSDSFLEAITAGINEQYNKASAAKVIDSLVVNGSVGISSTVEDFETFSLTKTNYFIASEIASCLIRVEFCCETESTRG